MQVFVIAAQTHTHTHVSANIRDFVNMQHKDGILAINVTNLALNDLYIHLLYIGVVSKPKRYHMCVCECKHLYAYVVLLNNPAVLLLIYIH